MSLSELVVLGFFIGMTGALAPGPTLIATIQTTIQSGWTSGPRITGGHIIAEALIVILIALGIPFLPTGSGMLVACIGGAALILFGGMTLLSARDTTLSFHEPSAGSRSPELAGLITSVANPYFWIWWFSVGSAMLISSLASGIPGLLAFISGHWMADICWFTFVSVSIHKSRVFMGNREYQAILLLCGISLIGFGGWFIYSGLKQPF